MISPAHLLQQSLQGGGFTSNPFPSSSPVENDSSNSEQLKPNQALLLPQISSPSSPFSALAAAVHGLQHYLAAFTISAPPIPGSPLPGVSGSPCAGRLLSFLLMSHPCPHLRPLTSLQATEIRSGRSLTSATYRLSSVNLV